MSGTAPSPPSPALLAMLRDRSEEIEAARRLPDDVADAIRDEALFRSWVPAAYGGPEHSAMAGLEQIAAVAEADGAAGWCVMIAQTTSLWSYTLPPEWGRKIFGPADAVAGGWAYPAGRAVPLPGGGLRVTGRWSWGSGIHHCTTVGGGVVLVDADGVPRPRADGLAVTVAFFDLEDVEIHDTWHVMGLAGSGSCDYSVTDAIVPEGRWAPIGDAEAAVAAPLARFPTVGLLALGISAVSVGLARRALAETVALARHKSPQGSRRTLAERGSTQADVARAEATVRSAWAFVREAVGSAWDAAAAGEELSVEQRRLLRLAATDAVTRCAEVTRRLHLLAGGADAYLRSPIQRSFRDAHVATQHILTAERVFELVGRLALGLDTDTAQL